jgi:hypothetical protein
LLAHISRPVAVAYGACMHLIRRFRIRCYYTYVLARTVDPEEPSAFKIV